MKKTNTLISISIVLSILGGLIIAWYLTRVNFYGLVIKKDIPNLGQVGDFIGGFLGALFSLVGTLLLIATLRTQRDEIKSNSDFLYQQQFETSFFSLLTNLNEHIKSIEYSGKSGDNNGKKYFIYCQNILTRIYDVKTERNERLLKIINTYEIFYIKNRHFLASYFRILYRIFDFINEANFKDELKFHYSKIVRATLSESELFLLHYNSLTKKGENFRTLIVKYNILKHLPVSSNLEFKPYFCNLSPEEFSDFKYITDEISDAVKISIADIKHIKTQIKFTDINVSAINLTNGIRVDIAILKDKKHDKTFFEKLDKENQILYLQDILWEICVFSNFGTLLNSVEEVSYNKEFLTNYQEDTIRLEMNLPSNNKIKILKDRV